MMRLVLSGRAAGTTAIAALLAGCAAFGGVKPTNLGSVVVGAGREDVEAAVGEPSAEHPLACGTVAVYAFDRGRKPYHSNVDVAAVHPAAPILAGLISHPFLVAGQQGELDVVYGPDGRVLDYVPGRETERMRAALENGLAPDRPPIAEQARRYYEAGLAAAPGIAAWGCFCVAAHLGNDAARREMARSYQLGLAPVSIDAIAALTWSLLAEDGASAADSRRIAAGMTDEDVAAARRAAAAWQPNTAACRRTVDAARSAAGS